MPEKVFINDTAIVEADIFGDDQGMQPAYPDNVTWDLADPNGNKLILSELPVTSIAGDIVILSQDNGGFLAWDEVQWDGSAWFKIGSAFNQLDNYKATLTIPGDVTDIVGVYRAVVHFALPGPVRKSQLVQFEVYDPLGVSETTEDIAIDRTWMKLEDCFDSALGGPWLRDMTLAFFSRDKVARFVPDALTRINLTYYPVTSFTEDNWNWDADGPLFSQALLVEVIQHLMRAYVEQPMPTGSPITWFNRTEYTHRWKEIFDIELDKLNKWLDAWKLQFFQFGSGAMLIGGYASTALRSPRALRTRLPRYYAGMYRRW